MEKYSASNPRRILEKIREQNIVKIYVNANPPSICALRMLIAILEREIIKYEISVVTKYNADFSPDYKIFIDLWDQSYSNGLFFGHHKNVENLDSVVTEMDLCISSSYTPILMYELSTNLNCVDNTILWPLIVVLDFNRNFYLKKFQPLYAGEIKDDDESEEEVENTGCCSRCDGFYREVVASTKKLNSNKQLNRIFLGYDIDLLFINNNTLFSAISNDINFIMEKKLFYTKRDHVDKDLKTKEFFAQLGISKIEAFEKFVNISHDTKQRLKNSLRSNFLFYKKVGYDILVSSLESYFLIYCFLLDSPVHSIINLNSEQHINTEKSVNLYLSVTEVLKSSYYRIRSLKNIKYLILNDKIKYKNRAMFLRLLLMFFKVTFKRQDKDIKMMIVHEDKEEYSIVVSDRECASKYLQGIDYWPLDTFCTEFGLNTGSLKQFYRRIFKK